VYEWSDIKNQPAKLILSTLISREECIWKSGKRTWQGVHGFTPNLSLFVFCINNKSPNRKWHWQQKSYPKTVPVDMNLEGMTVDTWNNCFCFVFFFFWSMPLLSFQRESLWWAQTQHMDLGTANQILTAMIF
jgi:hypothetical protein